MALKKLLIANRGEIAIRIARTAAEMGIVTVAVYSEDDTASLHTKVADEAVALKGAGPQAYLDQDQVLAAARAAGCDAIHPGYGFLSENAVFASVCEAAGMVFIGPASETLSVLGDKAQALALAKKLGLPVLKGTKGGVSLVAAKSFFRKVERGTGVMVKAVAGGGGRGMRPVRKLEDLDDAFLRCESEAKSSFGDGSLYLEQLFENARHVEVQIVGDGQAVSHLWDRECSLQRQRQKLVEVAPADRLPRPLRESLFEAALKLGEAVDYRGLGTIEFLVSGDSFAFIEANPRLQVEHTVTEAVTGLDLVRIQIDIARGASLDDLDLTQANVPQPRGHAVQARVNLETLSPDGSMRPGGGVLSAYDPPAGPGVRVDGFGYAGYRTGVRFDSLLAKVVVHAGSGGIAAAIAKCGRALSEFRIEGASTNIGFLQNLLEMPEVVAGTADTQFVESHLADLIKSAPTSRYFETRKIESSPKTGAQIDNQDPLAVLTHGRQTRKVAPDAAYAAFVGPEGTRPVLAPLQGAVVSVDVSVGETVRPGQPLMVLDSMKMEHVVSADFGGIVRAILVGADDIVLETSPLAYIEATEFESDVGEQTEDIDLDEIRPDLAELFDRRSLVEDKARPDAVARRRRTGQRTTRENIDDLLDPDSFIEYGALVVAARRARNSLDELQAQTPADGMVMGLGAINGHQFPEERARAAVLAYDYSVLAGTQGAHNHQKLDRLCELILRWRLPTVFFTEGGGGRPGDTEPGGFIRGFELWGKLSGAVPLVGITSGRCFAGNAAILGCCDVIIATRDSALGMGGPAMVEGGGLGVFRPEEIGPIEVMQDSGVIDVLVQDEAEAVAVAKSYLAYFQGPLKDWNCADQRLLRRAIPENRLRVYDVRKLIETLVDEGSFLELRPRFGRAMVIGFVRIEGRPMGLIANNPKHISGAIDSDASDKAARFLQLCEAFDLPVLSLSDTPGNMVGPEAEKTGLIRHCARLFVIGANLTVPIFSIILRKSYGLGAIAMTGGSYQAAMFSVSWPTGEFGGMGLEGAVKLGYRKELEAIEDPIERKTEFDAMVARAYERGKALSRATNPISDDVIDPAETRRWLVRGLKSLPPVPLRREKKLPWIDSW